MAPASKVAPLVILAAAFAGVGGSSLSSAWSAGDSWFSPPRLWVPRAEILHWHDTGSDRQYALDALALKYLPDAVHDPALQERIERVYWCETPVNAESDRVPVEMKTAAALRARARSLAASYTHTG